MNNAPRKRLGAYTVPMLKRLTLLALPMVVLALLGGSIVLAQQNSPGDLTAAAPQATPQGDDRTVTPTRTPALPTATGTPNMNSTPNERPPSLPATPTPTVVAATPTPQPPLPQQQPVPVGAAYLAANVPPNLQAVREIPLPPSAPVITSAAAMTVGDGVLRAVQEPPSFPSPFGVPMVGDDKRAPEAPLPPSVPTALNAPAPNLMPVRER